MRACERLRAGSGPADRLVSEHRAGRPLQAWRRLPPSQLLQPLQPLQPLGRMVAAAECPADAIYWPPITTPL